MIFLVVEKKIERVTAQKNRVQMEEIGDSKLEALPAIIIFDAA